MSRKVSKIFLSSGIEGLKPMLERSLPGITFQEVSSEDLAPSSETMKAWNQEVLVADNDRIGQLLYQPKERFAFVQGTWAGIDPVLRSLEPSKPLPSLQLCRYSHPNFSQLMSEYLIAHIISTERGFPAQRDAQRRGEWDQRPFKSPRCLTELTVGLLGTGQMGRTTARLLKAFGCRVLGLSRGSAPKVPCEHVDEYFGRERLQEMLESCDYICATLPKTPETDDIIGKGVLEVCKARSPVLINIGRGNILSDADLLTALDRGWLHAAVLDVFNTEPLPAGHAFWTHPDVTVTPHVAAVSAARDVADCARRNVENYESGRELESKVDWEVKY